MSSLAETGISPSGTAPETCQGPGLRTSGTVIGHSVMRPFSAWSFAQLPPWALSSEKVGVPYPPMKKVGEPPGSRIFCA